MRTTTLVCILAIGLIAVAAGSMHDGTTSAQVTYADGLSVTLRAAGDQLSQGAGLDLDVEIADVGTGPLVVTLGCEPPFDFQVFDDGGNLVWRLYPACDDQVRQDLVLQPGDKRSWTGTWTGMGTDGVVLPAGRYNVYGLVMTVPQPAVAGPLTVFVGDVTVTRPPIDSTGTPTATRTAVPTQPGAPTATVTAEPTETAAPTETPVTPQPSPPTPTSLPPFPVADETAREVRPDVAGGPALAGCQHLVVWWNQSDKSIRGRLTDTTAPGPVFVISDAAAALGPPKVAYHPTHREWLVVWARMGGTADTASIAGRYVGCDGPRDLAFGIGQSTTFDDQPAVAAAGDGYAVVWRRASQVTADEIMGAQVAGTATLQPMAISSPGTLTDPALACENGGPCLVAWTQAQSVTANVDVLGRMWSPAQARVATSTLPIATTPSNERHASVAYGGSPAYPGYLVSWTEEGGVRTALKVRAAFAQTPTSIDSYIASPSVVEVGLNGVDADWGDVAPLGLDYVVSWVAGPAGAEDIAAARLRITGATRVPLVGPALVVTDEPELDGYPAVSAAEEPLALVVWQADDPTGNADIRGRYTAMLATGATRVVLVGTLLNTGAMVASEGDAYWTVRVQRVLSGQFLCSEALVRVDDPTFADPVLQMGDQVTVSADPVPSAGECVLAVGAGGTHIYRTKPGGVTLPYVLRD